MSEPPDEDDAGQDAPATERPADATSSDAAPSDASPSDASSPDTSSPDVSSSDVSSTDASSPDTSPPDASSPDASSPDADGGQDLEALRERVEAEYDFENFGPSDMAEMSPAEWEAAFDDDAWITGPDLLDRVEADLRSRVATRDVFAVVERLGGERPRLVAYSDHSYAIVHQDGTVEGEGAVLRDVKPTVALASMPEYEVPDAPADAGLPAPDSVAVESSRVGNLMLTLVSGTLLLAALVLFGAVVFADLGGATIVAATMGLVFLLVGGALLFTVANARLSTRYRAEEFRDRLRSAGVEQGERPDFLPVDDAEFERDRAEDGELATDDAGA
jgi:hypothetical protein